MTTRALAKAATAWKEFGGSDDSASIHEFHAFMSTELPQLSDADRAAIEHIWNAAAIGTDPCEALARYFLAAGLERAAVICETYFPTNMHGEGPVIHCVHAIRVAKGATMSETLTDEDRADLLRLQDSSKYSVLETYERIALHFKAAGRAEAYADAMTACDYVTTGDRKLLPTVIRTRTACKDAILVRAAK